MEIYVAVTDNNWYKYLADKANIDEVNFWQPSGKSRFHALNPGDLFLFKLHSPYNKIAGGGFFAHSSILPVSLAWDAFEEKNGASSYREMRKLIEKYRKTGTTLEDYKIGCIILTDPFFFSEDEWIPQPENWRKNIVRGKTYDTNERYGRELWEEFQLRLQERRLANIDEFAEPKESKYGEPVLIKPRLGQGSFRILVTDVYQRKGAVTQEKALPTLEAAHIKPFSESGPNDIGNGILFRSDIHRLFDKGYATISPNYHFEVSGRIKEEFHNGETYYKMHGSKLHLPGKKELKPKLEFITWHNENVYLG
ncbi:HNH endonuclease [candidate division WOR-3 bacterium]|nr:HNH endonuclease [candidate division WOR-3 bacterium]